MHNESSLKALRLRNLYFTYLTFVYIYTYFTLVYFSSGDFDLEREPERLLEIMQFAKFKAVVNLWTPEQAGRKKQGCSSF
jgi:hypothetical protein